MILVILQSTKAESFKDGSYLGLAIGAVIILYILSRKFIKRK